MKRLIFNFYTIISAAIIFSSCHKDTKVIPQDMAATNSPSIITMLTSAAGYVLYGGTTVPAASYGTVGAYYLDLLNGTIYGPKTASGWGSGLSLKGNTGAPGNTGPKGAAGSKIYAGGVAPAATTGAIGDYYLDRVTAFLYGPKTASGWGIPVTLKGPAGPPGNPGPTGPAGKNANVFSDVFTLKGSDWLWNSQYVYETSPGSYTEYFTRYYVRPNSKINADVLNNGMVLVYFTPSPVNNPNQWEPLPYQFDSSFGFTYNYEFVPAVGQVTLHYFFIQTDPAATLPTLSTYNDETRQFKVVTILGEAGIFMLAHHVNLNNYQEVSKVTGLWQQDAK
ncbi:hypothetical protein [Mucilaginibacter gotjawali]|uniref:Collagen-like protein n=1 Tax=Mucilaginibacter gotjawali TaxID=1550579 RepID=A0A839SEI6_9SPHI|nr:hypothetical protein [Mucilaginibacter gotjawali]MBB3055059.1 hypothetical protein [Mucilaginibacter gotjawali]